MNIGPVCNALLALVFAPLLFGIINRVKAMVGGRVGQPLLQPYFDIIKLLKKGAVYSKTTTWVFRAGPIVGLASVLVALVLIPFGGSKALVSFQGDLLLFAYMLGVMRFFTVIAALDTGSAFEGMGASREVQFSALAEPALLVGLVTVAKTSGSLSLYGLLNTLSPADWASHFPELSLVTLAVFVVFLCENARIPIDDPNTHLELTMIHEVMVLDHGGPDFAFITYAASLKMWVLGSLIVGLVLPYKTGSAWLDTITALGSLFLLVIVVGVVESTMARLRLLRVPQLLVGAGALSAVAFILMLR